ncbi:MAG TPA: hypothetical protein VJQ26_14945 [Ktedonobacteraceae bacterium]|nr:hypothetical protein [Ktedonobacteraceae bacterium]
MSHEQHSKASACLPRPWLFVARLVLLAISVLALVIYLVGTPVYFAQLILSSHHCLVGRPCSLGISPYGYARREVKEPPILREASLPRQLLLKGNEARAQGAPAVVSEKERRPQ